MNKKDGTMSVSRCQILAGTVRYANVSLTHADHSLTHSLAHSLAHSGADTVRS